MTEPAATARAPLPAPPPSGPPASTAAADSSARLAGGLARAHRVRRRDPVPLGAGLLIAVVGSLVLVIMDGSYLGLTVTTGVGYAVVTVGMVLQLGYSRQLAFSQSVFMGVGAYGPGVLETKYGFSSLESLLAVIGLALVTSLL